MLAAIGMTAVVRTGMRPIQLPRYRRVLGHGWRSFVAVRIAAKSMTHPVPSHVGQLSRWTPRLHEHFAPVFGWYMVSPCRSVVRFMDSGNCLGRLSAQHRKRLVKPGMPHDVIGRIPIRGERKTSET